MAYFDAVLFRAVSSGTGDFVVSSAITGYRTPAGASVPNADTGSYRAFSDDLTQWENGTYTYNSGTSTVSRTVTSNSAGNTSKINFTTAPQVGFVQSAADLASASSLLTGTVNINRIGSSGTRNSTTFHRGDDAWVAVPSQPGLVSIVPYNSTQTITIPVGATRARVIMWGGSGGSGGQAGSGASGAGGGGAYLEKYLTGLTAGNTLAYTRGAAGTAGASGNNNGGSGGNSSLASGTQTITTLTADGGSFGTGGPVNGRGTGGAGGTATNGDINISGQRGQDAYFGINNTITATDPKKAMGGSAGGGMGFGGEGTGGPPMPSVGNAGTPGGMIIEWYY